MKNKYPNLNDFEMPKGYIGFFKRLGEELKHSNRFNISPDFEEIIQGYISYHTDRKKLTLNAGQYYYRARINKIEQSEPYERQNMGAPPNSLASPGRINPEGISYLYLADSVDTAIAEVRPWVGAKISVAKFVLKQDVDVVTLIPKKITNLKKYDLKNMAKDMLTSVPINHFYFASPAHEEDKLAYLPSQYLAELFKIGGLGGLEYDSVLNSEGVNLVLFDPSLAECRGVELHKVNTVKYDSFLVEDKK